MRHAQKRKKKAWGRTNGLVRPRATAKGVPQDATWINETLNDNQPTRSQDSGVCSACGVYVVASPRYQDVSLRLHSMSPGSTGSPASMLAGKNTMADEATTPSGDLVVWVS